jgi:hypothetical protein
MNPEKRRQRYKLVRKKLMQKRMWVRQMRSKDNQVTQRIEQLAKEIRKPVEYVQNKPESHVFNKSAWEVK